MIECELREFYEYGSTIVLLNKKKRKGFYSDCVLPKKPKPLYGNLSPHSARFKEDDRGQYIEAEITTDQRKNKNFWREGTKYRKYRMPSKMKSK